MSAEGEAKDRRIRDKLARADRLAETAATLAEKTDATEFDYGRAFASGIASLAMLASVIVEDELDQ